jgi:hypothetical protein
LFRYFSDTHKNILIITHYNEKNNVNNLEKNILLGRNKLINEYFKPLSLPLDKNGKEQVILRPTIWLNGAVSISEESDKAKVLNGYNDSDFSEEVKARFEKEKGVSIEKVINAPFMKSIIELINKMKK